jgi:hypothetical protein
MNFVKEKFMVLVSKKIYAIIGFPSYLLRISVLVFSCSLIHSDPDQETEETQPYAPKAGVSSQVWELRAI